MTKEEQRQHVTHVMINNQPYYQHYFEVAKAEVLWGRGKYKNLVYVRMKPLRYDAVKQEWVEVTKELRWVEGTEEHPGFDKSHPTWNAVWFDRSPEFVEHWKKYNDEELS